MYPVDLLSLSGIVGGEKSDTEAAGGAAKVEGFTLDSCLNKFAEKEQLPEAETYYCSGCKQHLAPIKKLDLWFAPEVLILHLKRFQYIPGQFFTHREKISDLVDFPIEGLNLKSFVRGPQSASAEPLLYDLYAVSEHHGGLGGGHYTAKCQNPKDKKW